MNDGEGISIRYEVHGMWGVVDKGRRKGEEG